MSILHCTSSGIILFITFSGGMGVSYQGSVDTSTLPLDISKKVQHELSENRLATVSTAKKNPLSTDSVMYEFHYDGSNHKYSIEESQASDALLELIDDLRPYLKLHSK